MKSCAFTGHRPQNLPFGFREDDERCAALKEILKKQIVSLITDESVTHFISGMALGVDMYAAEIVLELKKTYPALHLRVPYRAKHRQPSGMQQCAKGTMALLLNVIKKRFFKRTILLTAWIGAIGTW